MILAPMSLLNTVVDQLGVFLPRLAAALVVLIAGLIAARVVSRVLRRALGASGLDRLAEGWGLHDALERGGLGRSLSAVISGFVKALIIFIVVLIAVSVLGLPALEQSINEAILFLPRLVVALVIVMLGLVAGNAVRGRVDRLSRQMELGGALGMIAMAGVLGIAVIIAAAQIGIPTMLLILLATTLVAGLALTVALSVGLGTRHIVGQLAAGRYLGEVVQPGRRVRVGELEGEVVALQGPATTVRTDDGRVVRVPNRMLLESVITVDEPDDTRPTQTGPTPPAPY